MHQILSDKYMIVMYGCSGHRKITFDVRGFNSNEPSMPISGGLFRHAHARRWV